MHHATPAATGRLPLSPPVIGFIAFFTLVDLFATQAILPLLVRRYDVSPAAMGVAVNASTLGMAIGAAAAALFGDLIGRRTGIVASLLMLAVPTALLAGAPGLGTFAVLRIGQGLCMATAFTLTLAHLGAVCSREAQAGAFAAYITGNVASNLVGRLLAASAAATFGLTVNFYLFSLLNLLGAALAFATVRPQPGEAMTVRALADRWRFLAVVREPGIGSACAVGFSLLFAFIGVFSYVNFVLMAPGLGLGMMGLGFVCFVFLPSLIVTPLAGRIVAASGTGRALNAGLALAALGLVLVLVPNLEAILAGLALFAVGAFLAQAIATGFVSRAAGERRGVASGLYLASYFSGGLAGAAVLGQCFVRFGWAGCVGGAGLAILVAAALGARLRG